LGADTEQCGGRHQGSEHAPLPAVAATMECSPATGAGPAGGRVESDRAGQRLLAHGRIPHSLPRLVRRNAAANAGGGAPAIDALRRPAAMSRSSTEPLVNHQSASFREKPQRLRRQRPGTTVFSLGIGVLGMIKLNRIGNKLGLAGAIGVLLAAGMVVNQMTSEVAVEAANVRVARSPRGFDTPPVPPLPPPPPPVPPPPLPPPHT